jgi:hypothetical protein
MTLNPAFAGLFNDLLKKGILPDEPTEYEENIFCTPEGSRTKAKLERLSILVITAVDPELEQYCIPLVGYNSNAHTGLYFFNIPIT